MAEPVELRSLVYDNTSGAREIAVRALQLLQRASTLSEAPTSTQLIDELADLAVKVVRSKPEMASVFSVANRALVEAEAYEAAELGEARVAIIARLQDLVHGLDDTFQAATRNAADLIHNGDVVFTYSRSSTVLGALKLAKEAGKLFDVVTAESRPNLEGRTLAKELAELQVHVRVVVDAILGTAIQGADRVLVGADAITTTDVVNKAGTRLAALAARENKVPFHVASELGKAWIKKSDPIVTLLAGRMRDPKEVWDHAPYGVEVVNLYFDLTPLADVTNIVNEDGTHTSTEFWDHVRRQLVSRRFQRTFAGELA
jgi:translation initiation factor 2B subunit (eIF-2B alpha/beta/delta family)